MPCNPRPSAGDRAAAILVLRRDYRAEVASAAVAFAAKHPAFAHGDPTPEADAFPEALTEFLDARIARWSMSRCLGFLAALPARRDVESLFNDNIAKSNTWPRFALAEALYQDVTGRLGARGRRGAVAAAVVSDPHGIIQ